MLHNYFKIAVRNILRYKFYSFINIFGLTIGIACCLMIGLYIYDELSFDRFHHNSDQMYKLALHGKVAGQDINTFTTCPPLGETMVNEIPGIESFTRYQVTNDLIIRFEDQSYIEKDFINADSNFFTFFNFPLIKGDPHNVLKESNSIVLTEFTAQKYFGNSDPIGQIILIGNDKISHIVTGVAKNPPQNSHITFTGVRAASNDTQFSDIIWINNYLNTYVKMNPETTVEAVNQQIETITAERVSPQLEQFIGITYESMVEQGGKYSYYLFPLQKIHLHSAFIRDGQLPAGDIKNVYIFGVIGVFILLIACINFMNLSTARSSGRAKEVGIRKTMGSERGALIKQFLAESIFYSFLATTTALFIACLSTPYFNTLAGKNIDFHMLFQPTSIILLLTFIVVVGLLAGSYPAFYLTSFNSVDVLKGKVKSGVKSGVLRSALVVFQFALSIGLIICTSIVYKQISFMQNNKMGFDKHEVIVVQNTARLQNNQESLKTELQKQANILKSSFIANSFPGVNNTTVFRAAGTNIDHVMGTYPADWDHSDVMKFEIKVGRYFSRDFPADSTACVINEAAMRELGWTDHTHEEIVNLNGPVPYNMKVIGVVKDFNFESMRENVRPLIIQFAKTANNLMVRYQGNSNAAVASIENTWKSIAPNEPLQFTFLDENFDSLFRAEQRMGDLFILFTLFAIFVASLGLFGLAAFTAEQRTKEIGVRKVLGASVLSITTLLSKEFTRLVIIAFVLAVIPSWFAMDRWLSGFAYHTSMGWEVFVLAGTSALIIAWLTVSYQSLKAAMTNPVDTLKYE